MTGRKHGLVKSAGSAVWSRLRDQRGFGVQV